MIAIVSAVDCTVILYTATISEFHREHVGSAPLPVDGGTSRCARSGR